MGGADGERVAITACRSGIVQCEAGTPVVDGHDWGAAVITPALVFSSMAT